MVTEEATPLLLHPIVLKHIKEASVAQLMKQHVHVLSVQKGIVLLSVTPQYTFTKLLHCIKLYVINFCNI